MRSTSEPHPEARPNGAPEAAPSDLPDPWRERLRLMQVALQANDQLTELAAKGGEVYGTEPKIAPDINRLAKRLRDKLAFLMLRLQQRGLGA